MQRKHIFIPGEFYHIYNRGNSKQEIFIDDEDRDRFIKLLYLCNSKYGLNFREDIVKRKIDVWDFDRGPQIVSIGAWVLMPNHFHIYVSPKTVFGEEEIISKFVKKLLTSYSKYFNKRHDRVGGLFEGPFKSVHIETDEQAKYLFSYIHLNPIKLIDPKWKENGIKDKDEALNFLNNYEWSSYHDYQSENRPEANILSTKDFPEYFYNAADFDSEIFEWLSYQDESIFRIPVIEPQRLSLG